MKTFNAFTPEALSFLQDLKANNTREWFAANKAVYEAEIKEPGALFAEQMAGALTRLTGTPHGSKVFRIHRDVRFSKDKTPYNAHFHVAFMPEDHPGQPPMWFFGLSPERLSLGCGVFQYQKDALDQFRAAMAGPKGAELITLSDTLRDKGFRIADPDLKRVPAPYDKDHPNAEALRRKGFAAWIDQDDAGFATSPDLVNRTVAALEALMPVYTLMTEVD